MQTRWMSMLGLLGASVFTVVFSGLALPVAEGQSAQEDPARVRELAERLLVQPFGYPYGPGFGDEQPPRAQLLVGQLAPEFPMDLPLPPGGRLLGSLVRSGGSPVPSGAVVEAVLDAPGSPTTLQAFFADAFSERGWRTPSSGPYGPEGRSPGGSGFQPTVPPQASSTFCSAEGQGYLTVSMRALSEETSDVRFTWYSPAPEDARGISRSLYTPCDQPETPGPTLRPPEAFLNPIPRLVAPAEVRLRSQGGGGGPGSWSSEALAETDWNAAALAAYFGPQLAEAGWTVLEEGSGSGLAWSSWRVVMEEREWRGVLLIVELPEAQRRSLSVRVYSPTGEFGPYGSRG